MRCNSCWREVEGRAKKGIEDANKILSSDGVCPICDQVLSKSLMRPVELNPGDEWINMAMAGLSPQILMKNAYRSVMFFIGQKELEMHCKMNKIVGQCRQKCEAIQEKFSEKLEQVHTAYQKMAKKCQLMEQDIENLTKDKQELQEKYAEKSRQKRKLDEMYDQLRNEYELMKRSAIQPARSVFSRAEPDLFSTIGNMMDSRDPLRQGEHENMWPTARQRNFGSTTFNLSGGSPAKTAAAPAVVGAKRQAQPLFEDGMKTPATTLRNLIISPMKRPQLSRSHPHPFTL